MAEQPPRPPQSDEDSHPGASGSRSEALVSSVRSRLESELGALTERLLGIFARPLEELAQENERLRFQVLELAALTQLQEFEGGAGKSRPSLAGVRRRSWSCVMNRKPGAPPRGDDEPPLPKAPGPEPAKPRARVTLSRGMSRTPSTDNAPTPTNAVSCPRTPTNTMASLTWSEGNEFRKKHYGKQMSCNSLMSWNSTPTVARRAMSVDAIEVYPVWSQSNDSFDEDTTAYVPSMNTKQASKYLRKGDRWGDINISNHTCVQRIIVRPSSMRKLSWDIVGTIMIMYDMIVIPMSAFDLGTLGWAHPMACITTAFWSIDLLFSFTVGYHDGGIIEMRPHKIAGHYLRSWFLIDAVTVCVDWTYVVGGVERAAGLLRMGKSMRIMRVLRLFRLLRVAKVMTLVDEWSDVMHSESLLTVIHITKLVAGIALINHFIACSWYAIGMMEPTYTSSSQTWVQHLQPMADQSLGYLYGTSLHWSLTQFTPASMEVTPRNAVERIFNVLVIIFALVMFSSFITTITQAITRLRDLNGERMQQQENMRRFISEHQVSLELGNRIRSFQKKYGRSSKQRVHLLDIQAFKAMPETLMVEIHAEVFMPTLAEHPFFARYILHDDWSMVNVCHFAMQERPVMPSDDIFISGQTASDMCFVTAGQLEYIAGNDGSTWNAAPALQEQTVMVLKAGASICEMCLWMPWKHLGRLTAQGHCETVRLGSAGFRAMVGQLMHYSICCKYAQLYCESMRNAITEGQQPTDLWTGNGPEDDVDSIARLAFEDYCPPVARQYSASSSARTKQASSRSGSWKHGSRSFGASSSLGLSFSWRNDR